MFNFNSNAFYELLNNLFCFFNGLWSFQFVHNTKTVNIAVVDKICNSYKI